MMMMMHHVVAVHHMMMVAHHVMMMPAMMMMDHAGLSDGRRESECERGNEKSGRNKFLQHRMISRDEASSADAAVKKRHIRRDGIRVAGLTGPERR